MKAFLYVAMVVGTFGCATSQPVKDVVDAPIMTRSGKETLTYNEVAKAIERGGRRIGWQMIVEAPGLFTARLLRRAHLAEVEIQHDSKTYSIRYRDSLNLDASDTEIHKAYNTWVDSLDKAIRSELEML